MKERKTDHKTELERARSHLVKVRHVRCPLFHTYAYEQSCRSVGHLWFIACVLYFDSGRG